jgi:excisionase family DNA binding protein
LSEEGESKKKTVEELLSKIEVVLANQEILQSSNHNRIWFSRAGAADYLDVSDKTIDRYRRSRKLPRYVLDGSSTFRFKRDDLDKLMKN